MTDNFDPYHVWFGIPPEEQPPNYYRLLGIRLFETNADAIDNMADQRMTHLRSLQTGKHGRLSQKLLNEVTAARLCLLNPTTKQQYDAKLRAALPAAQPAAAPAPLANQPTAAREPLRRAAEIAPVQPFPDLGQPAPFRKQPAPRPKSFAGPMIGGGIALFAVIALGVGYAVMQSGEPATDNPQRNVAAAPVAHEQRPSEKKHELPATSPTTGIKPQSPRPELNPANVADSSPTPELPHPASPAPVANSGAPDRNPPPNAAPPAVAENTLPAKPGPAVDLLALVDPRRNAVRSQWRKENGAVVSDRGQPSIISIPFALPAEYRITMVAERVEGDDAVSLGLVAAGHSFTAGLDNFSERGGISGFELLDGHRLDDNAIRYNGKALVNGKPSTIVFTVAKDHFSLARDGEMLADWPQADYSRCSLSQFYRGFDATKPFIATWNSVYRISRLELTPLGVAAAPTAVADHSPAAVPPTTVTPTAGPPTAASVPDTAQPDKPVAKLALPDDAAQAKGAKTIQDVYSDQIKAAVSSEQKLALAKKLRDDGLATRDDPVAKFVMLKMARDLAAAQGDLDMAGEIVDKLAEQFEIEPLAMKGELLFAAAKTPQRPDDLPARLNSFADDAVAADRYDLAKRALTAALTLKGDPAARKQTIAHQKEIAATEVEFNKLKSALAALAAKPDDADANLAVGRFDCLVKGDFDAGLPLLAKGSDKALAELAKRDLAKSADAAEQIKVADGWWETAKKPARLRAKAIYETALPNLSGIAKVRIEKRLQEFEAKPTVAAAPAAEPWTNLLTLVDADKNAIRGKWTNGKDGLQCTDAGLGNSIMVPQDPGSSYELKMEFERLSGNSEIMLMLPVNGSHCRLTLGAFGRNGGGIDMIDGKDIQSNPTGRPARLENNKRVLVDVVVRNNAKGIEILVRVNGTDFTAFRGPASQLTGLPFGIKLPNDKWLALGAQNSTAVFSSLQYRKLPAAGK